MKELQLSDQVVRQIRRLAIHKGLSYKQIAAQFGMDSKYVGRICSGMVRCNAGGPITGPAVPLPGGLSAKKLKRCRTCGNPFETAGNAETCFGCQTELGKQVQLALGRPVVYAD